MRASGLACFLALSACATNANTSDAPALFQLREAPAAAFATPLDIAKHLVGNFPESVEGRQALDISVASHPKRGDTMLLSITATGLLDDSVRAEQWRAMIAEKKNGWRVLKLEQRWKCYRSANPDQWVNTLCL